MTAGDGAAPAGGPNPPGWPPFAAPGSATGGLGARIGGPGPATGGLGARVGGPGSTTGGPGAWAGDPDAPGDAEAAGSEPHDEGRPLKGWLWMTAGMLGLVLGVLWTAQGLDLVHDSIMSGVTAFAVVGPVLAVAGLALIVAGVRIRARSKPQAAAAPQS